MNFYGPQKHVPSKKSCERQKFANGLSLLKNCLELVKQTTLNVFILYIGRIGNFKKCMHRCCPNIQFCALSTCVKLCRGSKSKTAIGPDGKHKHFIVLRIFSNLYTHICIRNLRRTIFICSEKPNVQLERATMRHYLARRVLSRFEMHWMEWSVCGKR